MSDIKARYVGHPDGVRLQVPVGAEGEYRHILVEYGHELPAEIDGLKVPATFRDSLLEQKPDWSEVRRETKPDEKTATVTKADDKKKEA